jgi:lysyl-tRNA synthetase, class II
MGMHEAARRQKLVRLQQLGIDPWGGKFSGRSGIGDVRRRVNELCFIDATGKSRPLPDLAIQEGEGWQAWLAEQGEGHLQGPKVRVAGRILLLRDKGKLKFLDVRDQSGRIQLFLGRNQIGEDAWAVAECCDLGDLVAADGELRRTKTGELTVFVEKFHFLTKALEPPPEKHKGLTDPEMRHRMRYVDLAYNEGVLDRFLERTRILQSVRTTLCQKGFCEVEGPTLQTIAGGAAARPFITHHNALDLQMYLRIALELHLKRLLVGGIERVFELGRVFRNEGLSPRHNPEFTMLEVYEAYGNYETMMELTEAIIVNAVDSLERGRELPWGDSSIRFKPPFARVKYDDLILKHTGIEGTNQAEIARYARTLGIETHERHPDVIKSDLFEQVVEKSLEGPVFVMDYPASICPLTKRKAGAPHIAERFELYVHGMELANAYTELNDPDLQEELFRTQLAGLPADESMAKMDHDFIRALRHGMPPTGGLGIGMDRLVMVLTNTPTIRDVILFPVLRPESAAPTRPSDSEGAHG